MNVLLVDDEENVVELVKYNLKLNNFNVEYSYDGNEGYKKAIEKKFDLLILDIMLPGKSGLQILKKVRDNSINKTTPILMLTAKSEESDLVFGFEMGADDYLSKPFRVHELVARCKSLIRRGRMSEKEKGGKIVIENLSIDEVTRKLLVSGDEVITTKKEFDLLYLFMKNVGVVFSREQLLNTVWGYDYLGETRTIDVHIRNLRKKIEADPQNPTHLKTSVGYGYKFE